MMRLAVSGLGKVFPSQTILSSLNSSSPTTHDIIDEYASILCKSNATVTLMVLTDYICRHPVLSSWLLFVCDICTPQYQQSPYRYTDIERSIVPAIHSTSTMKRAWFPEEDYLPKIEYEIIDDSNDDSANNNNNTNDNNDNTNDNTNDDTNNDTNNNNNNNDNNDGRDPYDDPVMDEADPKEEVEIVPTRPWFALADMLRPNNGKGVSSEPTRDILEPVFVYGYCKYYKHYDNRQCIQRTLFYAYDHRVVFPSSRYILTMEKKVNEYDANECHWSQRILHGHYHPISALAIDRNRQILATGNITTILMILMIILILMLLR